MTEEEQWQSLKLRLAKSPFRSRFRLGDRELRIIAESGMSRVEYQCREFLRNRLAPAFPPNDGRQTPMKGHPCFIAQHATGICCRGCLAKWHGIPAGRELTGQEAEHLVRILMFWISEHAAGAENIPRTPDLFS